MIELDPVDRITTDAIGAPGERIFYLQARSGDRLVTLLVEKQQVQLLAASVVEILSRVGKETGQGPPEEQMGLEEPIIPEWRAGRLSIGYHEERDMVMLEVEEVAPEEEAEEPGEEDEGSSETSPLGSLQPFGGLEELEEEEEEEEEGAGEEGGAGDEDREAERVRLWATREQMLSFARHGAAVCSRGRPRCPLCGNPMEPEGHRCPALNGHGELGRPSS